jgi:AmiR/NasT family two-component response regulator
LTHNSVVLDDHDQRHQGFSDETLAAFEALRIRARAAVAHAQEARDRGPAAERVRALVEELEATAHELDGLRTAMHTRATIEQAKGVIMALRGCTADEAFQQLVTLSQRSQRKLHDVAARLVADVSSGHHPGVRAIVDVTSKAAQNG